MNEKNKADLKKLREEIINKCKKLDTQLKKESNFEYSSSSNYSVKSQDIKNIK